MEYYICNLHHHNNWHLPPEVVASRTFNTEQEAKDWFKQQYPKGELIFTGFYLTYYLPTNWVFLDEEEIGEITIDSHNTISDSPK